VTIERRGAEEKIAELEDRASQILNELDDETRVAINAILRVEREHIHLKRPREIEKHIIKAAETAIRLRDRNK
jgi:hypothetical protein